MSYALANGSAHPLEAVVAIGRRLAENPDPTDYDAYVTDE